MISARFDDLRPQLRRGFALGPIDEVIEARNLSEVGPAMDSVAAAVDAGNWVAGWVTYEAAPAFDPALEVRSAAGTALANVPLVWFGVSASRRDAPEIDPKPYTIADWRPLTTAAEHAVAVKDIRESIRQGDTYQANFTFGLETTLRGDLPSFYDQLIRSQSCGYGALIESPDWVVASASPELFFEWRDNTITCRPMKGTVRRGVDLTDDARMREWLAVSEKNRAENLMITDMVRNDLGRIAEIGTVEVPALFTTEKYDTLWQMTSEVTAQPTPDTDLWRVFSALFPSASITGAPKVSTMGIISRLESAPRGVYCGAIGFGGPGRTGPEWSFNVGIRTVLFDRLTDRALYGTGGGITYDSEPQDEHSEAVLKAQVLNRLIGELELFETTRWDPDVGSRHLDRHLARMAASAEYFDIPFEEESVTEALAESVADQTEPKRIRILLDRRGQVSVEVGELPITGNPIRLAVDDRAVDRLNPFLHHKTTMREPYRQAIGRHPEADDVLLWNETGEFTETTIGNVAFRMGGEWITPPLACGLLAGTERAALLAAGKLREGVVRVDDLAEITDLARFNSVRGWERAVLT